MAGYSGRPLAQKLGIKEGMMVSILNSTFEIPELPPGVAVHREAVDSDVFLIFATDAAAAEADFKATLRVLAPDGAIWMAWPKKSSGVDTDITENTLRDLFLPTGLVDNKVCAIDETWSGLRFVVRKENRQAWGQKAK